MKVAAVRIHITRCQSMEKLGPHVMMCKLHHVVCSCCKQKGLLWWGINVLCKIIPVVVDSSIEHSEVVATTPPRCPHVISACGHLKVYKHRHANFSFCHFNCATLKASAAEFATLCSHIKVYITGPVTTSAWNTSDSTVITLQSINTSIDQDCTATWG